jgi:nucleoid-associated protein YgaU
VTQQPPKKKNVLDRFVDLVSTRDEKEAVEQAQNELEAAKQAAAAAQEAARKSAATAAADKAEVQRAAQAAEGRAAAAEARIKQLEEQLRVQREAEARRASEERLQAIKEKVEAQQKAAAEAAAAAAAPKIIAEHTVKSGETLSHISLKHYGSAAKPYYMVVYEANKEVIGDNPNLIKPGMVLRIPELPAELKK